MLSLLWIIASFLVALIILVTVHEFGHFWVARRLGVKVIRFSIGFGKVIFKWCDKHNTEYALSVIPLGGYVKMVDEREGVVAKDDLPYAFNRKPLWVRIAVVLAGPLFNILFAVIAYWFMFYIGIAELHSVVGNVDQHSIAGQAGLQANDKVIAVNGQDTQSWSDVRLQLLANLGKTDQLTVTTEPYPKGGKPVQHRLNLQGWTIDEQNPRLLSSLGITPYLPEIAPVVGAVEAGTPADHAGLMPGDSIVRANKRAITAWQDLLAVVAEHPGQKMLLQVERSGQVLTIPVTLEAVDRDGKTVGFLGVSVKTARLPEALLYIKRYGVFSAFIQASQKTWDMFVLSWQLLGKLVTGDLSLRSISGPIGIAQGAGYSASLGVAYFFNFLALISISLAMVNLLPIPLLDGGHLLFYLIEAVTRRPVSERVQLIGMRIGLLFLLAVMLLAFYNDLSRW